MGEASFIHPRREPFEHGLIPLPKLIFSEQTLTQIKQTLTTNSNSNNITPDSLSSTLQISTEHANLVLDVLVTVLHKETEVQIEHVLLFLYLQSYKRLLPRGHKDSASVADVWPSTSAFDGYLSALSPLQLVRSNSRRFMPSQADEEAHQLTYLQKHLPNILSLLSDSVERQGQEESLQVLTMEKFEHLEFLLYFGEKDKTPLSQTSPFFANSDPDMPAAPVSTKQVHDWLLEKLVSALEHVTEKSYAKENGAASVTDPDVPMTDACASSVKPSGPFLIEGISKTSYVKQSSELKGSSVKVVNCHDSVLYILAPLRYATVYGCSDATIVLGAIGKAVRVEHCERVHIIVAAKRICIANCRECLFFLGVNQRPLIVGDNHKLQVAPYNTYYSHLEEHMNQVGIEATINRWGEPVVLGVVDPHDSLSHSAGVSDVQAESAATLDPDQYTNFFIPNWFEGSSSGITKANPFALPDAYMVSQQRNNNHLSEIKQILRETPLEDSRRRELSNALHVYFKDWLYGTVMHINTKFIICFCILKPWFLHQLPFCNVFNKRYWNNIACC